MGFGRVEEEVGRTEKKVEKRERKRRGVQSREWGKKWGEVGEVKKIKKKKKKEKREKSKFFFFQAEDGIRDISV